MIDRQVELMHERDIWVRPGKDGPAEAATPFAVLRATLAAVHDRPGIRH